MSEKCEELLKHFADQPSDAIKKYAKDKVLKASKYIFIESGKYGKGYCTYCNKYCKVEGKIKAGTKGECPNCSSDCVYKHAWRGRNSLFDHANFLYFEKSIISDSVVTATWYYALNDFREDYKMQEVELRPIARYLFFCETGESCMMDYYYWSKKWMVDEKIVTPDGIRNNLKRVIATHTVNEAVSGTKLMYSQWTKYFEADYPKYFALFLRYPSIEILNKAGKINVVKAKLYAQRTHSAVNWQATKLHNIFKVSKADLLALDKMNVELFEYWLCQLLRKEKSKADLKEFFTFAKRANISENMKTFNFLRKYVTLHRMMNYVKRQFALATEHYSHPSEVMTTWRDYLEDCIKLEMNLKDDAITFPRDLEKQHQKTMKKVKHVENERLRAAIVARKKQLEHFDSFTNGKYIVRVPETAKEIVEEGNKLSHCVGTYADRHVKGECTILFVRAIEKPNEPLYTLEVRNGKIAQLRGLRNENAPKEARDFVEAMLKEKNSKKAAKRKVRKTA